MLLLGGPTSYLIVTAAQHLAPLLISCRLDHCNDVTGYAALFARPHIITGYHGDIVDGTYTGVYHVIVSLHSYFDSHRRRLRLPGACHRSMDYDTRSRIRPKSILAHRSPRYVYLQEQPHRPGRKRGFRGLHRHPRWRCRRRRLAVHRDRHPLLWRPITGFGSFDLPTCDMEITPFLGRILDRKPHEFGFGVTDALNVWLVDANLHLWLDEKSSYTSGSLIKCEAPESVPSLNSQFRDLDGLRQDG
ncbi:hypothetical protein BHM03_00022204 [Ensete ventricosum]|nr:hypothetical protein BHM03_00022204 [Ensete ventricosum]